MDVSDEAFGTEVGAAGWIRSALTGPLRAFTSNPQAQIDHPRPNVLTFRTPTGAQVSLTIAITTNGEQP